MSDLFKGQSMSEAFKLVSGGAAYTLSLNFQPDMVIVNNLTQWTGSAGGDPRSFWFRGQTAAAQAYQQQVIDSAAAQSFNFLDTSTNGFTVADTSGGIAAGRALISGISQADPCVVTTTAVHGYQTDQRVRLSDLGSDMPTARGMEQVNNQEYLIVVINTTSFSLKDVVSGEAIDSSAYTAWVSGGRVNLVTRVLQLNVPQVSPYDVSPYASNAVSYDPIDYKLTLGSSVIGADSDVILVESHKWGLLTDLSDIG